MSVIVKVVTSARARALVEQGIPWIGGYVTRGGDVPQGLPVAQLVTEWGLEFPGSPYTAQSQSIDIVRMPASPVLALATPGGQGPYDLPPFRDHSPMSGTGFVESASAMVPYWWLQPSPIPAGSTLWRIHSNGQEELLATFMDVAHGWIGPNANARLATTPIRYPDLIGTWATVDGERMLADVLPDGNVLVCSSTKQRRWNPSPRGAWTRELSAGGVELEVVRVTGKWHDLPVQLVGIDNTPTGPTAHIVSLAHNAHEAEAASMAKTDAGVYEHVVPITDITSMSETRTTVTV